MVPPRFSTSSFHSPSHSVPPSTEATRKKVSGIFATTEVSAEGVMLCASRVPG